MAPKIKFTKEEIVSAALEITREKGFDGVSARIVAERLGASSKVIFGAFSNMEELKASVIESASALQKKKTYEAMTEKKYPPYKAAGMAYIEFASEEKELFKLLFMRDRTKETVGDEREEIRPIIDVIRKSTGLDEEKAYLFHLEMWLYVHGIATMVATDYLKWDKTFVENVLTDAFLGLKHRFCEEEKK